jgi:hypothetical protein
MFIFYICSMDNEFFSNKYRLSPYKLNPNSDRYRVCPFDKVEFMADHRSRIFCSDKCADDYHNQKKREGHTFNKKTVSFPTSIKQFPITEPQKKEPINKVRNNESILDKLKIDPVEGSIFHIDWLRSNGFDFNAFDGRKKIIDEESYLEYYLIEIGKYQLTRVEYAEILITKTTN